MADPSANTKPTRQVYTYYHAGPLFTLADLRTNIDLSSLIHTLSLTPPSHTSPSPTPAAAFQPLLPQNLEPRDSTPHAIRDQDIRSLISCDAALFVYDGAELDAGTVVEYTMAKAADVPCVLLRTDFRGGGDQAASDGKGDNWNLMSSNWPRTKSVSVDSMAVYKRALADTEGAGDRGIGNGADALAAKVVLEFVAAEVVQALREVVALPPRLPRELREPVYEWLGLMPGFKGGDDGECVQWTREVLKGKVEKRLL
jgi:nucleoside 2-deoxyribosyltransferase